MLSVIYSECHKQPHCVCHYGECHYGECHYGECHYGECRYGECPHAEFRGIYLTSYFLFP
jgi:hypothetical protein